MTVTFQGFNTHPGLREGQDGQLDQGRGGLHRAPAEDRLSPETTDDREGFVHPYVVQASVDRTSVRFLIRDFTTAGLKEKERFSRSSRARRPRAWPGATVTVKVEESLPQHEGGARPASRRSSRLRARSDPPRRARGARAAIRGGTDGSRLSFMGLPTPNIFAGEHNFHSRFEWVSAQDMEKAVEVIVHLARIWEERTPAA